MKLKASPQIEDGYTKIANEIFDELAKIRIPGEARQCLDVIFRKTYGFNKKTDAISNSQFVENTGLSKQHVSRAINKLLEMNLVTKNGYSNIPKYCFNKAYNTWKPYPKKVTVTQKGSGVTQKGYNCNPKRGPQKKKETNTKERLRDFIKQNPAPVRICKLFISTFDETEFNIMPKTDAQKLEWLKCAKWAIERLDKYGEEKVCDIIDYFRNIYDEENDDPKFKWRKNFQSLLKLKKLNSEGIHYIDYFWSQLEGRVKYVNNGNNEQEKQN